MTPVVLAGRKLKAVPELLHLELRCRVRVHMCAHVCTQLRYRTRPLAGASRMCPRAYGEETWGSRGWHFAEDGMISSSRISVRATVNE